MQSLCRFTLAVPFLSTVLASAPAHAGRASACKAPPFSVPKETQRAVDAAIDARITGAGAGGASSSVAVWTDYETTTLSQDAAARAWASYTLCLKLAKKLISQDLHDELLRGLMEPPAQPRWLEGPATGEPTAAEAGPIGAAAVSTTPDLSGIVGTWQVTSRFLWSTCPPPNDKAGVSAYTWLIGVDAAEAVQVTVIGQTSYPRLSGAYRDGDLLVTGDQLRAEPSGPEHLADLGDGSAVTYRPRSVVSARFAGTGFTGTRDVLILGGPAASAGAGALPDQHYTPCVVRLELTGTR